MSFQFRSHQKTKRHFLSLAKGAECQVTYVWIEKTGEYPQCKTRTLDKEPTGIRDIPEWNIPRTKGDVIIELTLVPVRIFRDPFSLEPEKLVLCEVLDSNRLPNGNSQRLRCAKVMEEVGEFQPWFGMEQEYTLFALDEHPSDWSPRGCQTTVNTAVQINKVYGRDVYICHYKACLYAGVKICDTNTELFASQWKFQVGPCEGIEMGDHLWMARFIMHRVCEDFGIVASFKAKPIVSNIDTSGCHTSFSTKEMRSERGLQYVEEAIRRLNKRHSQHLRVYSLHNGADNTSRLTSGCSTSGSDDLSTAIACRTGNICIPDHVSRSGCGYLEDRRPDANCDPYAVKIALVDTCLLETTGKDDGVQ